MSCKLLGSNLTRGKALPLRDPDAIAIEQRACELGVAPACLWVAHNATATAEARPTAVTWFAKACALRAAEGCVIAANTYATGFGVGTKDAVRARAFRARACRLHDQPSCATP